MQTKKDVSPGQKRPISLTPEICHPDKRDLFPLTKEAYLFDKKQAICLTNETNLPDDRDFSP